MASGFTIDYTPAAAAARQMRFSFLSSRFISSTSMSVTLSRRFLPVRGAAQWRMKIIAAIQTAGDARGNYCGMDIVECILFASWSRISCCDAVIDRRAVLLARRCPRRVGPVASEHRHRHRSPPLHVPLSSVTATSLAPFRPSGIAASPHQQQASPYIHPCCGGQSELVLVHCANLSA